MPPRKSSKKPAVAEEPAGSLTARERLLQAGVEIFSRYGFEGATTRRLASAAKVNLATILYYFGGKEEYYLAVARHIADTVGSALGPSTENMRQALAGPPPSRDQLAELLIAQITAMAKFLLRPEMQPMSLFILREQVFPTQALDIFHDKFMLPMHELCCKVVGMLLGIAAQEPEAAIRAQALFGEITTFFTSRTTLLRHLGSREFTEEQVGMVVEIVTQHIRAILASLRATARTEGRLTPGFEPDGGSGLA